MMTERSLTDTPAPAPDADIAGSSPVPAVSAVSGRGTPPGGSRAQTAPEDARRPLSRAALYDLARQGSLDSRSFEGALRLIGVRPGPEDWTRFWFHLLTLCGALFLASGVIFFIAWNWNGLHHFAKFGILQGLIAAGTLIAVWRGVNSAAGAAALLASGLCIGPLLAVFGQSYMSGAHSWELFRAWACMLLPFALLGRQAGLWLLVWLTSGAWGLGYAQYMSRGYDVAYGLPEFLLLQMLAVAVWELALRRSKGLPGREWLRALWLPRLMVFAIVAALTLLAVLLVFDGGGLPEGETLLFPLRPFIPAAYAGGLCSLYFWYRSKRPDLFMLGCGVFSACAVLVALILKSEIFASPEAGTFLIWGIIIAGLTAVSGKLLLYWQRSMEAAERADGEGEEKTDEAPSAARNLFAISWGGLDWKKLREELVRKGLWPEEKDFPLPPPSGAPWYIKTMLSFGGWISAVFLIVFLGFLLFSTLDLNREVEGPLFLCGLAFLGIGAFCARLPGVFARQFGLASAFAGALAAISALVMLTHNEPYWPLPCLLVCLASFVAVRNRAYRYTAAVFGVFFLYALFDSLILNSRPGLTEYFFSAHGTDLPAKHAPLVFWGASAFWAALCAALAQGWHAESRWMTDQRFASALPPLLHGIFTAALLLLVASLTGQDVLEFREFSSLFPPPAGIGLGAAAGFILLVFLLGRGQPPDQTGAEGGLSRFCLACALLALPMGWHLPGLPLALLGFLVSRQTGAPVLFGASALFLAAYLFRYYYHLEVSLLHKSFSLMGCGVALLIIAALIRRFFLRQSNPAIAEKAQGEAGHA